MEAADLWLLQRLYAGAFGRPWLDVISVVTFLGSGWMLFGLVPALFLRRIRARAVHLLVTLALTSLAVASIKALSGRVRPCHALAWARGLPIAPPTDFSFPSGHAAGSFALAVFVFAWSRRAGAWLVLLACAIALSRVALGVHYPTDVAAGAVLGSVFGFVGARVSGGCAATSFSSAVTGLTDADSEAVGQ